MDGLKYEEKEDLNFANATNYDYSSNLFEKHLEDITSEPEIIDWCKNDETAKNFVLECGGYLKSKTIDNYQALLKICEEKGMI